MVLDHVNRVIKFFVLSDLLLFAGWGLISPIFSVFVVEDIVGATLVTAGVGSAVYWLFRSLVQVPIATLLDKTEGEQDDFYALVLALVMAGIASFLLAMVRTPGQLYLVQVFHGASFGVYQVAWPAIFSRHMDKGKIAFDWSLDRASIGIAIAVTSILGARAAELFGFQAVFILTGFLSIASALVLFAVPKIMLPKPPTKHPRDASARIHRKHKTRSTIGL